MVKLIRVTTNDQKGLFENIFNEDIVIEKNSKVALHSMTCEIESQQITIDAQNDTLFNKFISSGEYKECHLEHGTYTSSNFQDLLADATIKLNKTSKYEVSDIGKQWEVTIPSTTKKVTFNVKYGSFVQPEKASFAPLVGLKNVVKTSTVGSSSSFNRSGGIDTTDDAFMWFKAPNSKGSSSFSAQIANNATKGFMIAYLADPPDATTNVIDPSKILYGIRQMGTVAEVGSTDPIPKYKLYFNGNESVNPTYSPQVDDYLSLDTSEGTIKANIYRGSNIYTLFTYDYDHFTNLFPVVVFSGGSGVHVQGIRFNADPVYEVESINEPTNEPAIVGIPLGPANQATASYKYLKFGSIDLALTLGFDKIELRSERSTEPTAVFEAVNIFRMADLVDSFVLELLNIPLDSHDGLTSQRRNILHTIVQTDVIRQRLTYTAPYPLYIDMKNANQFLLRELRARILREDLTTVNLSGFSQITLLISE